MTPPNAARVQSPRIINRGAMAALLRRFNRFPQPEPGPELLANAASNQLIPWWRRGGMGIFEHGAILSEFVPAFVLLHILCFRHASALLTTPGAIVSIAIPSWFAFREGIRTGDGSVIASILVPLYFLAIILGLPGLPRPLATLCLAAIVLVAKLAVCMSAVLHRWAAHSAFKCSYPMSVSLALLGCLATQGGPVWWASKHRAHHKFCDKSRDPHSAKLRGLIGAFAWFGKEHKYIDLEFSPAHLRGSLLLLIDTYAFVPTLIEYALVYRAFGVTGLYVSYASGVFCKMGTLWFNISNHPPGQPADAAGCMASDDGPSRAKLVAPNVFFAFTMAITRPLTKLIGESMHHHHHDHAHLAHRPGGIDLAYFLFIRPLQALGLIWDVKTEKRDRGGDARLHRLSSRPVVLAATGIAALAGVSDPRAG